MTFNVFLSQFVLFLRICNLFLQVRANYRTSITIPAKSWGRFRDVMSDFIDQVDGAGEGGAAVGGAKAEVSSAKAEVKEEEEVATDEK